MKQKADHHLEFLADRSDKPAGPGSVTITKTANLKRGASARAQSIAASVVAGGDEDAAGESDDAVGEEGEDFQKGAGARRSSADGANQQDECEQEPATPLHSSTA
jgi:transcriptional activator SPT7